MRRNKKEPHTRWGSKLRLHRRNCLQSETEADSEHQGCFSFFDFCLDVGDVAAEGSYPYDGVFGGIEFHPRAESNVPLRHDAGAPTIVHPVYRMSAIPGARAPILNRGAERIELLGINGVEYCPT